MNSVTPFLTSAGVFCEFTNLDPCDSALWDFAGFSSPFQSTKLSTQNHPESSLWCVLMGVRMIFCHSNHSRARGAHFLALKSNLQQI